VFHTYVNPMRDIPMEAFRVHGISEEFLKDKPIFPRIVDGFLEFIGTSSVLVIHNANFDISFLNAEFALCGLPEISISRTIDTLNIARKKFPGSPASLDALCKRFNISLENREKHGALIDAELLASVYIELIGGGQSILGLNRNDLDSLQNDLQFNRKYKKSRNFKGTQKELEEHEKFLQKIKDSAWRRIANT
jgi:DNA polymerase III subunit epsilon